MSMRLDHCIERLTKIESALECISYQMDPDYYPFEKHIIKSYSKKIETAAKRVLDDYDHRGESMYYSALLSFICEEMRKNGDWDEIKNACQCYSMSSFYQKAEYVIKKVLDQSSVLSINHRSDECKLREPIK